MNGIPGTPFKHGRGLRQGDPLSLLLFILAIDPLQRLLDLATKRGALQKLRWRIQDVGLEELLKMESATIRRDLCKWLAEAYDIEPEAYNIRGSMLRITLHDVEHLLGLSSRGQELLKAPSKNVPHQGAH